MAAKLDWWQQVKWRNQIQQEKVDRENAAARLVQVGSCGFVWMYTGRGEAGGSRVQSQPVKTAP
jgi:hypothetical protein